MSTERNTTVAAYAPVYTVKEVSRLLHTNPAFVYRIINLGLLPALDGKRFERQVSLTHNASARYEDRWVRLAVNPLSPCVFTRGLNHLMMPVRHGEGRLVVPDDATLDRLEAGNLVTLSYADPQSGRPTME